MNKNNFDFLRFLFAFIVVIAHIIDLSAYADIAFLRTFFDSHLSVTGFFIISGFLIYGSYTKSKKLKDYFIKRAKRLLPAYIFVIIASMFFFSLFSAFSFIDYFSNSQLYKYFISNLFFLNFIQPCLPGVFLNNMLCTINGALWTIKVEVSFYLVLPIIVFLINKISKKYFVFILFYILSLLYQYGLSYIALHIQTHQSILIILKHQLPGFITYFISGMALFHYFDFFNKNRNILSVIAIIVFSIEYYYNVEILRPIAMSIIIFYLAYVPKFFNNWGKYGDISYGIYIFHFPLIQLAVSLNFFTTYNAYFIMVSIILTVLVMAFLSWNLLEKRFLKRATVPIINK